MPRRAREIQPKAGRTLTATDPSIASKKSPNFIEINSKKVLFLLMN
jgi:hypothetical protein